MELQIKTTRYHDILSDKINRLWKMKEKKGKLTIPNANEVWNNWKLSSIVYGNASAVVTWEKTFGSSL